MEKIYDIVIIGGGPAALSAGVYAGRSKLDVLVIEKSNKPGQISITEELVNYPGILETSGSKFMSDLRKQAINFGTKFVEDEVIAVDFSDTVKKVTTKQNTVLAHSVIIATGASPRKLGFKGEEEFAGRGVAYCATCDGEFFTGLDVFVIGAGFAAAEEAMFLTKYAKQVTIIAREPDFTCAKTIGDKVKAHPKIKIHFNTELLEIAGDKKLKTAKFINNQTKEITEYDAGNSTFGVFVFVGYAPESGLFKDHIELTPQGFIPTNEDLMTNVENVYAVGDIRDKRLRQVVTAVADGAIAATSIERYIQEIKEIHEEEVPEKAPTPQFLDEQLTEQLKAVVSRFANPIEIVVVENAENEESDKMVNAMHEVAAVSDSIKLSIVKESEEIKTKYNIERTPVIVLLDKDGNYGNLKYASLPGGHELNSFILGMYNVAGPGQKLEDEVVEKIKQLSTPTNIKVGISLACTKCPKTIQSIQKIVSRNKNIEMEMINIFAFPEFKEKYDIMSVPAIIVNDKDVYFGEKDIEDILQILNK